MPLVLVINAGSSSFKYKLLNPDTGERIASGLVERIGEPIGTVTHTSGATDVELQVTIPNHTAGFERMAEAFTDAGTPLESFDIVAVGHRVVQGGDEFVEPTLIDDHVQGRILHYAVLAPLHNPGEHEAIVAARRTFPRIPHVAVFDTAFHQTMPPEAYTYAIDPTVAAEHGIRRYGFHGTSHAIVSRLAAEFVGRPVEDLNQIVMHLGNGASVAAIRGGKSVDTSMGFTPLEGLVMGTRSGDIDPSILIHLMREADYTADDLDQLLNQRSGLTGMTGRGDMRDVRAAANAGDAAAKLALGITVHRLKKYIGAYLAVLGGVDVLTFTAGIGENHAILREEVLTGLKWFGIELDRERNDAPGRSARRISTDGSRVTVLVVPTDEEREIAIQAMQASETVRTGVSPAR